MECRQVISPATTLLCYIIYSFHPWFLRIQSLPALTNWLLVSIYLIPCEDFGPPYYRWITAFSHNRHNTLCFFSLDIIKDMLVQTTVLEDVIVLYTLPPFEWFRYKHLLTFTCQGYLLYFCLFSLHFWLGYHSKLSVGTDIRTTIAFSSITL